MDDNKKFIFVEKLAKNAKFEKATLFTIDGMRVEFSDGWGLIRCSNTTPCLVLRFEANNEAALQRIQAQFKQAILKQDPSIDVPF
jgi:phosphomannomutase/phosphoglucomutase